MTPAKTRTRVLCVLATLALLWAIPESYTWPITTWAISMHEMGHAFAALLTGGSLDSIEMGSHHGVAWTRGGWYPIISMAGYTFTAWLTVLFWCASASPGPWTRRVLYTTLVLCADQAKQLEAAKAKWAAKFTDEERQWKEKSLAVAQQKQQLAEQQTQTTRALDELQRTQAQRAADAEKTLSASKQDKQRAWDQELQAEQAAHTARMGALYKENAKKIADLEIALAKELLEKKNQWGSKIKDEEQQSGATLAELARKKKQSEEEQAQAMKTASTLQSQQSELAKEKDALAKRVTALRAEIEDLAAWKEELTKDVTVLETVSPKRR